ncbi:hypothetical protein A3770_02p16410 [Chloropicon primus]|uniref:Uncharacterized protein n=1 Tax=Chloropicon primus TaxID=1764295 RepID=A0A5B8MF84_9CHLO|nr:hypothetical protein A3770_02p16410 [Chloropicon primus]|eukprot:QDZ19123.1 hypothetical protein A3770_02p16410 [Chloropicon primus]
MDGSSSPGEDSLEKASKAEESLLEGPGKGASEAKEDDGNVRVSKTAVRSTIGTIFILVVLLIGTNMENFSVLREGERVEAEGVLKALGEENSLIFTGTKVEAEGVLKALGEENSLIFTGTKVEAEEVLTEETSDEGDVAQADPCAPAFAALRETSKVVGNVPASALPFPHLVLDDVFPEDYYQLMLENVIDTELATSELFTRRSAVKPRYTLILRENVTEYSKHELEAIKKKVKFWKCHYLAFGSPEFTAALLKPFRSIVERRYNGTVKYNAKKFHQYLTLVQDRSEYFITPHTDVYTKFVTNLFYICDERDAESLRTSGTLILEPVARNPSRRRRKKKRKKRKTRSLLETKVSDLPTKTPPEGKVTTLENFDPTKEFLENQGVVYKFTQMEFRPNRLVAFAPCQQSWHAVPLQMYTGKVVRNTVQGFVSFDGETPDKESCTPF